MVRTTQATDEESNKNTTSIVDIRTTDLSEFEDGEAIRVHYRDAATEPSKCVTGRIETRYADKKALIVTDDDRHLVVDLRDVGEDGGLRDLYTFETIGRPMFAETAYHPEKDGEALRRELLGDDDSDDDSDEDDDGDDDDSVTTDTLRYENTTHGAHEKTGKSFTRTKTVEVDGEVYQEQDGLVGFRSPDHDGPFFVLPDGTVKFDPHDPSRGVYEVGTNGVVDRGSDE